MAYWRRAASGGTIATFLISVLTILCLVPFLDKAVHIDDTLFLYAARHIVAHPFDFFGFQVNWYGVAMPMANVMKNPPLVSYAQAAIGRWLGWRETILHAAFIIPAVAAAVGAMRVARRFTAHATLAALLTLITPAFLVSGTTLMSDISMLAFWLWAVDLWMSGIDDKSHVKMVMASLLITLCVLTKYPGICLVPLLWLYALGRRRPALAIIGTILPAIALTGYQWGTARMYGHGLLFDSASYAFRINSDIWQIPRRLLTGLTFVGGGLFPIALLSLSLSSISERPFVRALALIFGAGLLLHVLGSFDRFSSHFWLAMIQGACFAAGGFAILWLAIAEMRTRELHGIFLGAWALGSFVFLAILNWTVSGRSLLPLVPAAAILVARRFKPGTLPLAKLTAHLVPAAALSLAVVYGDSAWANANREAARRLTHQYQNAPGGLWFMGHWGFQYYMMAGGARPLPVDKLSALPIGAIIAAPARNTNVAKLPGFDFLKFDEIRIRFSPWPTTMDTSVGAGFYASVFGPLPFTLVPSTEQMIQLWKKIPNTRKSSGTFTSR